MIFINCVDAGFLAARPAAPPSGRRSRLIAPPESHAGSRTELVATPAGGKYGAFGRTLVWSAADPVAGNRFPSTGKEMLVARNTGIAATLVAVRGSPDTRFGRSADQILTIEPGDTANFGPFPTNGWRQSDRYVWVDAASSVVLLAVVVLP